MRRIAHVTVCLTVVALIVAGCGYGPDEPSSNTEGPRVSRGPDGPQERPTPPREQPAPPPDEQPPRRERPEPRAERPEPRREEPEDEYEPPHPDDVPTAVTYSPRDEGIVSGYLGSALGAARRAKVMAALASINQWLKVSEVEDQGYPKDMDELVRLYGKRNFEEPPLHYKYFYWPEYGVVKMVRDTDKRFRDPKGIHTRAIRRE